ncbi:MAG TPA: DEAD/DEAH box helicase [Thermoplasmata archaeon]|nr:DEAD/DEAH box helicase [Thermoplasmata archaeon]
MNDLPSIIDNETEERRLSTVINNLLSRYHADKWRFATGFFFFEGWKEIKDAIPNSLTDFYLIFGYTDELLGKIFAESVLSTEERKKFFEILTRKLMGKLRDDTIELLQKEERLKELIEKGIMKVRWSKNLHAKLYLFTKNEEKDLINLEGRAIVGSSNITARGLSEKGELNVFLFDRRDIIFLLDWFKRRWDEAKELSADILLEAILEEARRRKALKTGYIEPEMKGLTLLDGYLFLIWYFLDGVYDIEKLREELRKINKELGLRKHNEDPVKWGYQIINDFGGVILADPVGLGKSFQALGILAFLRFKKNISKALLITPPHLIENEQWADYIREFFHVVEEREDNEAKNYGIARNKKLICQDENGELEIFLISSYGLATLGEDSEYLDVLSDYEVIILDEAHHFKNIFAKRRRSLEKIIDKRREKLGNNPYVILLTATPILNDINELLILLSTYTRGDTGPFDVIIRKEAESRIIKIFERYQDVNKKLNEEDLNDEEKKKLEKEKRELLNKIRQFVNKILILRSRLFVEKKYWGREGIRPKLRTVQHKIKKEDFCIDLIDELELRYLDFSPSEFVVFPTIRIKENKIEQTPEGVTLQAVMKILLAKRLESSLYAFLNTLRKMKSKNKEILNLLYQLSKENLEEIAMKIAYLSKLEEGRELRDVGIDELEKFKKEEEERIERIKKILNDKETVIDIIKSIEKEIDLLKFVPEEEKEIYHFIMGNELFSKESQLKSLLNQISGENKKIIIFSMYKDTVYYLKRYIEEKLKDMDIKHIFLITGETKNKGEIINEFRAANGFSVLIATDSISEGINLEFVDYLINYDIPWTPSVIMQRVGRLWRVNRKKDLIFYNFIPPEELIAQYESIIRKITEKIKVIKDILVMEIKLLKESDELTEDFEDRVYGRFYEMERKMDIKDILTPISMGKIEEFKKYLLQLVENVIDGKKISEWIKEKEKIFENLQKEIIGDGKILNLFFEDNFDNAIRVFRFNKKYWMRKSTTWEIVSEDQKTEIFKKKWNTMLKMKNAPLAYRYDEFSEDKEQILANFKNNLKNLILGSYKEIKAPLLDKNLLKALAADPSTFIPYYTLSPEEKEKLREFLEELFFILFYYLENKKRSELRRKAINILKRVGVLENKNRIDYGKLIDINILKRLREELKGEVENIKLEVIF